MKYGGYVFILALVLIVILAGPSFMEAGLSTYSSFWETFWAPFTDNGNGNGDDANGNGNGDNGDGVASSIQSGTFFMKFKVNYADGSEKIIEPPDGIFPYPFVIWDHPIDLFSGGVEYFGFEVWATLNYAGTFQSASGKLKPMYSIRETDTDKELQTRELLQITLSENEWVSGGQKLLYAYNVDVDSIKALLKGENRVYCDLKTEAFMDLTVTFEDGASDSREAVYCAAMWQFIYEDYELSSVMFEFNISQLGG